METFVAVIAIVAWLVLMIPAACIILVGAGDTSLKEATSPPDLAIARSAGCAEAAARAAA